MPGVWRYVAEERTSTDQDTELYSGVAELYHEFRPRYPDVLIDQVALELPKHAQILEIGCGPGTATLPLLQRGYQLTCIEPGSGMMQKARRVCEAYSNQVSFYQMTLEDFFNQQTDDSKYDAIVAASSFHWALDMEMTVVKLCHKALKPQGKLVLLWNLPPEPDQDTRDAVARATMKPIPFHFGGCSREEHYSNIRDKILQPVEELGLFSKFSFHECHQTEKQSQVTDYVKFLQTLGPYIRMTDEERSSFFQTATETMTAGGITDVTTTGTSILNLSSKLLSH